MEFMILNKNIHKQVFQRKYYNTFNVRTLFTTGNVYFCLTDLSNLVGYKVLSYQVRKLKKLTSYKGIFKLKYILNNDLKNINNEFILSKFYECNIDLLKNKKNAQLYFINPYGLYTFIKSIQSKKSNLNLFLSALNDIENEKRNVSKINDSQILNYLCHVFKERKSKIFFNNYGKAIHFEDYNIIVHFSKLTVNRIETDEELIIRYNKNLNNFYYNTEGININEVLLVLKKYFSYNDFKNYKKNVTSF